MNNYWKLHMYETCGWKRIEWHGVVIWFKGYLLNRGIELLKSQLADIASLSAAAYEDIEKIINGLQGHYALVIETSNWIYATVDKVRSIPLFYIEKNNHCMISNHAPLLLAQAGVGSNDMNGQAILEFAMSGYTMGDKTLFRSLNSFQPGQSYFCVKNESSQTKIINCYRPWKVRSETSYKQLLEELSGITLDILRDMMTSLEGRQVVIPLSAGNDSRLVASGLRELGYDNVLCYSYGMKNNFEAQIAKKVANRLGYQWQFIELTIRKEKTFYKSKEFGDYLRSSETLDSIQYIQGLSSIHYLRESGLIDSDSIFVNGNSGDFISGGHVTKLYTPDSYQASKDDFERMEALMLTKHYNLWGYLLTDNNTKYITKAIRDEQEQLEYIEEEGISATALYEFMEFTNRQCKYVISGQRSYEYYGHEWRMPLWDERYLEFWSGVDPKWKAAQRLYIDMLLKCNFGDVWGMDIPVNKYKVRPHSVRMIRNITKIPFGLLGRRGRKYWRRFDKVFYSYLYDVTRMMCSTPYFDILKSYFKVPRHHVSFQVARYLKSYDIDINSLR